MRINKHDTNGTKPLLEKSELGYDDYTAGGDVGRVYVGTGAENIALAKRLEANMMTKAQFNALAEERKANRAGSGFEEWGKHAINNSINTINEGMYTRHEYSNFFRMGRQKGDDTGTSKTNNPICTINGTLIKVNNVNSSQNFDTQINLPTAPNIYPHDTVLTAEQIASDVIKHADSSNSGLIVNGKFDVDTSGWTANSGNFATTLSIVGGKIRVTNTLARAGRVAQSIPTVIGKKYELEVEFSSTQSASVAIVDNNDSISIATLNNSIGGRHTISFTAISSATFIYLYANTPTIGAYADFDNIAVYPADALSRSDLVFLESWHEDVSEKNFVYPLGNTQYLGGNTDGLTGIANGAFTGFEQYSLFGNWQTPSALIGKGYVWSSLTEAQKRAFIANPENNCYLDGDKVIQVRYRVRVAQGWGDVWGVNTNMTNFGNPEWGRFWNGVSSVRVPSTFPQGKQVAIGNIREPYLTAIHGGAPVDTDSGAAVSLRLSGYSYTGRCYALPIALVHRRNQGMYHNVYNPNGTKLASDGLDCFRTAVSFTSISDCFDTSKLLAASGYIGSVSGRPDGLFYDQVHESDITDLRNSSKKVEDYNRLIGKEFNKLVAGTTRGKEGEVQTFSNFNRVLSFGNFSGEVNTRAYLIGNSDLPNIPISLANGLVTQYPIALVVKSGIDTGKILISRAYFKSDATYFALGDSTAPNLVRYTDGTIPSVLTGQIVDIYIACPTTRIKSNTLLHCDIIGNPANYPTAWKESGVFGTPLIVGEDGTSLLPDGVRDTFKLSRKANATPLLCLRSTDNGVTWTSFTPTFSTATNAITLTGEPAGNLVLVYYQTHTSMAVPVVNSEVLEIGDVFGSNVHSTAYANNLLYSLINKVGVGTTHTYRGFYGKCSYYALNTSYRFEVGADYKPNNNTISFGTTNSPSFKVLPYLTRLNGKVYLNLVFKEMKHNGTSWGDDNKFNIVDNVSTTTDNNAQTVLIGQKTVELPYFIAGDE